MDAEKEACRAEDREKGIYYFPNGPKAKNQEGDNDESIADAVKDIIRSGIIWNPWSGTDRNVCGQFCITFWESKKMI